MPFGSVFNFSADSASTTDYTIAPKAFKLHTLVINLSSERFRYPAPRDGKLYFLNL